MNIKMTNTEKATYAFAIATAMNVENCKTFGDLHDYRDANELLPPLKGHDEDQWDDCNEIITLAEIMVANG
jgi:hypothetical protein